MTKYIFITGGVISGLGKGVTTASVGALLKAMGITNIMIKKLDPYLNIDPGTINPIEHGEVFVTKDGYETDLDLGYYERFTQIQISCQNSTSSGKLYQSLFERERRGDFLGKTIQMIPHFTDEIKRFITNCHEQYDIILCEIGGCVGDIEAMAFYEALRQLRNEEETLFIHLTYLVYYSSSKELKTKPTQNALKALMSCGIIPDILVCRSEYPIQESIIRKLSLYSNIPYSRIIKAINTKTIYQIPLLFYKQGVHEQIGTHFSISSKIDMTLWKNIYNKFLNRTTTIKIAIIGKYVELRDSYCSLLEALFHSALFLDIIVEEVWINGRTIPNKKELYKILSSVDGVIVPGGFGNTGIKTIIDSIQYVRENNIPFLGICLGLQCAVIEYSRNIVGYTDCGSREFGDYKYNVIAKMIDFTKDEKLGGTMRLGSYSIHLKKESLIYTLYKKLIIQERHRHRYDVDPIYIKKLEEHGLYCSGRASNGLVETIELDLHFHPFFIATQFHPEFESSIFKPHPLFIGLLQASMKHSGNTHH
jgi:CTP synthase